MYIYLSLLFFCRYLVREWAMALAVGLIPVGTPFLAWSATKK
jgi:hypothetical protein